MANAKIIKQASNRSDVIDPRFIESEINQKKQDLKNKQQSTTREQQTTSRELEQFSKKNSKKAGAIIGGMLGGPLGAMAGKIAGSTLDKKVSQEITNQYQQDENQTNDEIDQSSILNLKKSASLKNQATANATKSKQLSLSTEKILKKKIKIRLLLIILPTLLWLLFWSFVIGIILYVLVSAYQCYEKKGLTGIGITYITGGFNKLVADAFSGKCQPEKAASSNATDKKSDDSNAAVSAEASVSGSDSDAKSPK